MQWIPIRRVTSSLSANDGSLIDQHLQEQPVVSAGSFRWSFTTCSFSKMMPVDIGLENQAEPRGKSTYGKKLTPNPTLSDSEQRLLSLFDQLPKYEQHRLIEELKANKRGEP